MPAQSSGSPLVLEYAEEPILFIGPPTRLRGTIRLRNGSSEKAKLTTLAFDGLHIPGKQPTAPVVSLASRVYPNQQARVPALVRLDPSTPPGTYDGVIALGKQTQPVRLHVTEHADLRVEPGLFFIFTDGALAFERQLVAQNAGNVAVPIGGEWTTPLGSVTTSLDGAMHRGLKGACDAEGSEAVLKALLCAWSEEQIGPLSVRAESVTLQPAETRAVSLSLGLPRELRPFRRYVVQFSLFTAPIRVEIVTGRFNTPATA